MTNKHQIAVHDVEREGSAKHRAGVIANFHENRREVVGSTNIALPCWPGSTPLGPAKIRNFTPTPLCPAEIRFVFGEIPNILTFPGIDHENIPKLCFPTVKFSPKVRLFDRKTS